MAKVVNCECGEVVRGEDEDELVRNVESHVNRAHPELVGTMGRREILEMAEDA